MKIRIFSLLILFTMLTSSCSTQSNLVIKDLGENENANILQESQSTDTVLPSVTAVKQMNTTTPEMAVKSVTSEPTAQITNTATIQPTATATVLASCPAPEGYSWSKVFSEDTSYVTNIFPASDGNILISAVVDANDGVWVAKITPDGELIWQKKFKPSYASLQPAPDGNFLLEFQNWSVEINTNGNIVNSTDMWRFLPNADGSYTVVNGPQIMRYTDPESPIWSYFIDNAYIYGEATTDGGGIYAYAGSYVDKSVYYAPLYTDIKVIKIDGNGQIWQRVYGKLVGEETLEFMETTDDGGALLAGTHAYEDLGSDYDIWLMKVNQTGSISWQTTLKLAPDREEISDLYTLSQGYLVISEDYHTDDLRLVKLTKSGAFSWQKQVNSIRGRISVAVVADTTDGGLLLAGQTEEMTNVGFLVRLNHKGEVVWEKLIGFTGIANSPDTFINSILPLNDGNILLGGGTNLLGQGISDTYGAWLANIKDEGEVLGFLTLSPGKFSIISTFSSRPNNLPDDIMISDPFIITEITPQIEQTTYEARPACLKNGVSLPTPQALPSVTPSITPTPSFIRDLYLTTPENMQGDDVLKLQQRLLELGYKEVGVPDGFFGKMTQNAVRLFQEKNDLEVDGYVGPKTWQKLFSESAIPAD